MANVPLVSSLRTAGVRNVVYYDRGKPGLDGADIYALAYYNRGGQCSGWNQLNLKADAVEKLLTNFGKYRQDHPTARLVKVLADPGARGVVLQGTNAPKPIRLGGG
ncbi:hypothetical protein ACFL6C_12555 [Myxococcota bacterium]